MGKHRPSKDSPISNSQLNELKRRAALICSALKANRDEKVIEIAVESIEMFSDYELVVLGDLVQREGFFNVGEAIQNADLIFFNEE